MVVLRESGKRCSTRNLSMITPGNLIILRLEIVIQTFSKSHKDRFRRLRRAFPGVLKFISIMIFRKWGRTFWVQKMICPHPHKIWNLTCNNTYRKSKRKRSDYSTSRGKAVHPDCCNKSTTTRSRNLHRWNQKTIVEIFKDLNPIWKKRARMIWKTSCPKLKVYWHIPISYQLLTMALVDTK